MSDERTQKDEGWACIPPARTEHYYLNGRSLCGGYLLFDPSVLFYKEINASGACQKCAKRAAARAKEQQNSEK